MKLFIGFSPCPNDCFIFDALVHKRIDTLGIDFIPVMLDVEALNSKAFTGELEITKLSYFAFFHVIEKYALLRAGSALGFNCGPLLISKREIQTEEVKAGKLRIAIPGKWTTANFLLSIAFPAATNKVQLVFSDIERAVLNEEVDAGLIIHENRFTYQSKGLKKIADLGEFWENMIHAPIPLGGIAMRRDLDKKLLLTVERLIAQSVAFAFAHPDASVPFVRQHAQEMQDDVMKKHIELYVNQFSVDLGEIGIGAVKQMYREAAEKQVLPSGTRAANIFMD